MNILIYVILSLIIGVTIGYIGRLLIGRIKLTSAEAQAQRILEDAQKNAETQQKELIFDTKDRLLREREEFEREARRREDALKDIEERIRDRENNIEKRTSILDKKESIVAQLEKDLKIRETKLSAKQDEIQHQLEKISGLTRDEAKKLFLKNIEDEANSDAQKIITTIEEEARRNAELKAKEIICNAIQRNASEHTSDLSVTIVSLPNDDMKGRIIGREGRNIRSLESLTGVDVIIDDTPDAVVISGYDPYKREIAKISLEKLILDGRIHPTRIEEVVKKVTKDMEEVVVKQGEHTAFDLGIQGLHPELLKLLGKLNYRLSYGQNTLNHSTEVAYLSEVIAAEVGVDTKIAKRIGLLHDIGKCISADEGGSHALIGAEYAKKYNEDKIVVNAIAAHHGDRQPESIYAIILMAADAISASRPGARKENIDNYIKRLENLENLINEFEGVEKSYAIQAGREIRVMVENEKITDDDAKEMARAMAKKIEKELRYPGQIKVTVIRETRIVEYAK